MIKYKFPSWDATITDPTITVNGQVGTRVKNNEPEQYAFVDINISTVGFNGVYRLESDVTPLDWTMESIQSWVVIELQKYIVA